MKNQKEVETILKAIFCLNRTGANDKDITLILDYAFRTLYGCNTNMLSICCAGRTKEELLPVIEQMLGEETKYLKYKNGEI